MLVIAQTRSAARAVLGLLGFALVMTGVLYVANTFGIAATVTAGAVCFGIAAFPNERVSSFAVNFIAAQACIVGVLDIRVLFRTNLVVNGQIMGASDAHNMAAATFGTPWMWACVWLVWSFGLLYVALRIAHQRQQLGSQPSAIGRPVTTPSIPGAVAVRPATDPS